MAPMLFKGLKAVNISCVSPASTAVCSTTGYHRPPPIGGCNRGRPSLDSQQQQLRKSRNSSEKSTTHVISPAGSSRCLLNDDGGGGGYNEYPLFDVLPDLDPVPALLGIDPSRFHSSNGEDRSFVLGQSSSCSKQKDQVEFRSTSISTTWPRFRTVDGDDDSPVLKPSAASREQIRSRLSSSSRFPARKIDGSAGFKSSSCSYKSPEQVVVLRVSLHCKGCEGKVRKHLKKMEGVTSFNIDFATKKVTVIGDVTPLGVLSSISKVKNAQFWTSPPSPSSAKTML